MHFSAEQVLFLPVLWFSLICHEVGHAWAAYRGGDNTARLAGRLTLNPLAHLDPIGTVLIPILQVFRGIPLIGWAKPVPVNPLNFRSPKWDVIVSLAGVAMNLALLVAALIIFKICLVTHLIPVNRYGEAPPGVAQMASIVLRAFIMLNVCLAIFNLIPIPPLDGSHVFLYFIRTRDSIAFRVFQFLEQFGFVILLLLVFSGKLWIVIGPILGGVFAAISFLFQIPIHLLLMRI